MSTESEQSKPIIPSLQWLIGASANAEAEPPETGVQVPARLAGLLEEVERTGEQLQFEMERQAQRGANVVVGNLLGAANVGASAAASASASQAFSELPSSQDSGVGSSSSGSQTASSSQTLGTAHSVPAMLSTEADAEERESRLLMHEVLQGADEEELDESVAAMALAPSASALASGRREEAQPASRSALLASLTVDELRDEDLDRMLDEVRVLSASHAHESVYSKHSPSTLCTVLDY